MRSVLSAAERKHRCAGKHGWHAADLKADADDSTQTRSLRSRSRVDWAVEAARRVRDDITSLTGLSPRAGSPDWPTTTLSRRISPLAPSRGAPTGLSLALGLGSIGLRLHSLSALSLRLDAA